MRDVIVTEIHDCILGKVRHICKACLQYVFFDQSIVENHGVQSDSHAEYDRGMKDIFLNQTNCLVTEIFNV